MKNLAIECKGITNLSSCNFDGYISLEIEDVDYSFLESVQAEDIVANADNSKLLNAMDAGEVLEWIKNNLDVIITKERR